LGNQDRDVYRRKQGEDSECKNDRVVVPHDSCG
jgi:hypothetical protein